MKTAGMNKVEKLYFVMVAILFLILATNTFGQNLKVSDLASNKYAFKNIVNSIHSNVPGVRESAIYLVGKYRFIDTEDALIEQLKVENEADLKVLIGLALYRLNSTKGMDELKKLSVTDSNPKVKRMSAAIYNEYLVSSSEKTAGIK